MKLNLGKLFGALVKAAPSTAAALIKAAPQIITAVAATKAAASAIKEARKDR